MIEGGKGGSTVITSFTAGLVGLSLGSRGHLGYGAGQARHCWVDAVLREHTRSAFDLSQYCPSDGRKHTDGRIRRIAGVHISLESGQRGQCDACRRG
jgi:hypothetical protein